MIISDCVLVMSILVNFPLKHDIYIKIYTMRKSDKMKNFKQVNLIAEQRYLLDKGVITEDEFNAIIEEGKKRVSPMNPWDDESDPEQDNDNNDDDDDDSKEPEDNDDIGERGRNLEFGGQD